MLAFDPEQEPVDKTLQELAGAIVADAAIGLDQTLLEVQEGLRLRHHRQIDEYQHVTQVLLGQWGAAGLPCQLSCPLN